MELLGQHHVAKTRGLKRTLFLKEKSVFTQNVTQTFKSTEKIAPVNMCHMKKLEFELLDSLTKLKIRANRTKKDDVALQLPALLVKLIGMSIKIITELILSVARCW